MPHGMDPVLTAYMRDIDFYFPGDMGLTAQEEGDLARRIAKGDLGARDRLVESHLLFAFEVARRFRPNTDAADFMDIVQSANQGLTRAAELFRAGMGRFAGYAVSSIQWKILEVLKKHRKHEKHFASLFDSACADPLADLSPSDEEEFRSVSIRNMLRVMPARTRAMVMMRFGLKDGITHTVNEVGRYFNVAPSAASLAINRGLRRARERFSNAEAAV